MPSRKSIERAQVIADSLLKCPHPLKERATLRPGSNVYAPHCQRCGAFVTKGAWQLPVGLVGELARALDESFGIAIDEQVIRTCVCDQTYTEATWAALTHLGTWDAPPAIAGAPRQSLEFRRCQACGTSIAITVGALFPPRPIPIKEAP